MSTEDWLLGLEALAGAARDSTRPPEVKMILMRERYARCEVDFAVEAGSEALARLGPFFTLTGHSVVDRAGRGGRAFGAAAFSWRRLLIRLCAGMIEGDWDELYGMLEVVMVLAALGRCDEGA